MYYVSENYWKLWSFHYHNRNVNPIISKNGDGKNSLFVIQGTIIFPHSRLSSRSKKKFPHSRLRRSWENFFSLLLLRLSWGNIIVPFMTHREFLFPLLAASPLVGEISRPHFLKWWDWAIYSCTSAKKNVRDVNHSSLFCTLMKASYEPKNKKVQWTNFEKIRF